MKLSLKHQTNFLTHAIRPFSIFQSHSEQLYDKDDNKRAFFIKLQTSKCVSSRKTRDKLMFTLHITLRSDISKKFLTE